MSKFGEVPTIDELLELDRLLSGPGWQNLLRHAGMTDGERHTISYALRIAARHLQEETAA
jgi:hypothetical protein